MIKLSSYYCNSLAHALRHPLYNEDRQEFLDRGVARAIKQNANAGRWITKTEEPNG